MCGAHRNSSRTEVSRNVDRLRISGRCRGVDLLLGGDLRVGMFSDFMVVVDDSIIVFGLLMDCLRSTHRWLYTS